jgi:DNA repair exonuclease SbcCD nuclease subunit
MRVLFCGDKHLKINKFDLAKQFLSWLNKTIEKEKPDLYVCLGDDMDTHSILRSELLSELRYHFDYVLSLGVPIVYVVGNHDCFKPNDMKYHALQSMKGVNPNLYVVDKSQDLFDMTFVPYIHDPNLFPKETLPICVCHQTFKGADYGDITTRDGVDPSSTEGAQIFISGHIHKRQSISYSSTPTSSRQVIYIGSPFSQSVSDVNQTKGVSIFDIESLKETFIECPLPKWRKAEFNLDVDSTTEDVIDFLTTKVVGTNDHWVIDLTGNKSDIVGLLSSSKYTNIIKNTDIKLRTKFTDKEKKQISIKSVSIEDIVSQYVVKTYDGELPKEEIISTALQILKSTNLV